MSRKRATPEDPRGLIAESYCIEDLDDATARSIFLDWAVSDAGDDPLARIQILYDRYGANEPDHPMSQLLREGLAKPQMRRRGRRNSKID